MKRINFKKVILFSIGLIATGVVVCSLFGLDLMSSLGVGGGVVMAETAVVAGESVTTESTADMNLPSVYQKIVEMYPSVAPLDTLIRSSGREMKAEGWEVKNYNLNGRSFSDTVATLYTTVGSAKAADIEVDNIDMWNPGDTCYINTGTGETENKIAFLVEDVDRANDQITIHSIGSSPDDVPSIAAGREIIRMASAISETAAQATPYALVPDDETNYCQRFGIQFEESLYARLQKKEIEFSFTNIEKDRIYDYKAALDLTYLFGKKGKTTNSDRDIIYTMGGFMEKIAADYTIEYGKEGETEDNRTFSDPEMQEIMRQTFAANNGTDTRFMFAGSKFIKYLHQAQSFTKQLEAKNTEAIFGIKFTKYDSPFGSLNIKYHAALDIIGMGYSEKAIIVDLNNIIMATLQKMQKTDLDLKKSGQRNVNAIFMDEAFSILVTHPQTHAVIAPKA